MMHVPPWQDSEFFGWIQPIGHRYWLSDLHWVPVCTNPTGTRCCQKIVLKITQIYELKISPQLTFPFAKTNPSINICYVGGFWVVRPQPSEVFLPLYLFNHSPPSPLGTLSYRTLFCNGNMPRGSPIKLKSRFLAPKNCPPLFQIRFLAHVLL